ncbi:MAG: hypothetical protein V4667_09895 [Bacteroidota bacterium]
MGKGTIKTTNPGKNDGIIVDNSGKEYPFYQPELSDMAVAVNYVVEFDLLNIDGTSELATNFVPLRTATVSKITKDTDGFYIGELTDNVTKIAYAFKSAFAKNKIPSEGNTVQFNLVKTAECKPMAINVTL